MEDLTDEELRHLLALMGKDMGWHAKYKNAKKVQIAKDIYGKVKQEVQKRKLI